MPWKVSEVQRARKACVRTQSTSSSGTVPIARARVPLTPALSREGTGSYTIRLIGF